MGGCERGRRQSKQEQRATDDHGYAPGECWSVQSSTRGIADLVARWRSDGYKLRLDAHAKEHFVPVVPRSVAGKRAARTSSRHFTGGNSASSHTDSVALHLFVTLR